VAQDVDVVDRVLDQRAPACHSDVGAPARCIVALDGEVLVVAEQHGHRTAELARADDRGQLLEYRDGAKDKSHLRRQLRRGDRRAQSLSLCEAGGERLLAEDRYRRGQCGVDSGAVRGSGRADVEDVDAAHE